MPHYSTYEKSVLGLKNATNVIICLNQKPIWGHTWHENNPSHGGGGQNAKQLFIQWTKKHLLTHTYLGRCYQCDSMSKSHTNMRTHMINTLGDRMLHHYTIRQTKHHEPSCLPATLHEHSTHDEHKYVPATPSNIVLCYQNNPSKPCWLCCICILRPQIVPC